MTPPIDQRPSSFLLSFLQFVNFSKSLVDFGPAAQQFFLVGCAVASFGGIDASGLIHSTGGGEICPLFSYKFHGVFVEIIDYTSEVRRVVRSLK